MDIKFELFKEFGTIIQITDLDIIVRGTRLDYLCLIPTEDSIKAEYWAGNPDDDKYAEQILIKDRGEERLLLERIWEDL